jgi:hypothetical protein
MNSESIKAIMVELEVESRQSLFVLLTDDGLVNRLGTGAVDNAERSLFIGHTNEPLFAELRAKVQPEWMSHQGAYDVGKKAGRTCTLTIMFKDTEGQEGGFRFRYGSKSEGPPGDICQFVAEAVRLTDPWYEDQKLMAGGPKRTKPWWKIW